MKMKNGLLGCRARRADEVHAVRLQRRLDGPTDEVSTSHEIADKARFSHPEIRDMNSWHDEGVPSRGGREGKECRPTFGLGDQLRGLVAADDTAERTSLIEPGHTDKP